MSYRDFREPPGAKSFSPSDWVQWANEEGLIPSVAPRIHGACRLCYGAVGLGDDGQPFTTCYQCDTMRHSGILAAYVPIVYSVDAGLESLLHKYKDWKGYRWLGRPLASLTLRFMRHHLGCITRHHQISFATAVPSATTTRHFHPTHHAIGLFKTWPVRWELDVIQMVEGAKRPGRGRVDPDVYTVPDPFTLRGETVLLFDDTWTSGASMLSAAQTLLDAGARAVVGLTVGRQLNRGYGSANDLIAHVEQRGYDDSRCVLCA